MISNGDAGMCLPELRYLIITNNMKSFRRLIGTSSKRYNNYEGFAYSVNSSRTFEASLWSISIFLLF